MGENPAVFRFKPDVLCDGQKAEAHAKWQVDNASKTPKEAKLLVMKWHPACDWWKEDAMCDGIKASERADWLEKNASMSADQAKERVTREFYTVFRFDGMK